MDILYIVISLVLGLLLGVLGFLFLVYLNNKRIQESFKYDKIVRSNIDQTSIKNKQTHY